MTKVTLEFDFLEDGEHMRTCINAVELSGVISEAREYIRGKLKYGEGITENEAKILEEIREILLGVSLNDV
jgi:hypothetical protein